ncbi:aliphatic nitrilase [Rhodococcus sp. 05-2256-B2]|uniref:carbon-nitrogen hydrolase family protein n=1 Tax=Nocardiaceae TaxID=85025 RepID=UPI00069099F9|nr:MULTISPECIES: carbon-nitrogen hydrolase family protein [Rhodococcus]MBY4383765.1 carbon-nitrogen hydrolase family protein [Rhodococcus fascians]MBY4398976.1 carbon-nitrogen hydrolase family protein [Rhodococcus fascians]MBY4408514.1 carbon-nitrogen hydrolase family protein [Rhodococcus fascians]MBY4423553.1 carbon-nitrogen hydrolase family protein [Rhodococcus fascians]MBY4462923.1 carbon-nitrogen hydrolase family protein [Rhodococcus fascians]
MSAQAVDHRADDEFPRFRAAAVQASPVFLDPNATVDKACSLIREAADNGATLVAFPEVFVAGYPYWNWTMTPIQGSPWFEKLYRASIKIDGPEVATLCAAAKNAHVTVVIGVNERPAVGVGTLYNTTVTISDDGAVLGVHRKLVPTWAEKLTWGQGDGSSLKVHKTAVGPLGVLACGENTNTLARFALLAQGEMVHVAGYIALPTAPADYDMVEAIKTRSAAHAFEGKVFNVVACSTISREIVDAVAGTDDAARSMLTRRHSAFSGIFGPDGRLMTEPLIDDEGIVYADIDLAKCIQPKQMHDIIGHYNRFDIFDFRVDTRVRSAVSIADGGADALRQPGIGGATSAGRRDESDTAPTTPHQ